MHVITRKGLTISTSSQCLKLSIGKIRIICIQKTSYCDQTICGCHLNQPQPTLESSSHLSKEATKIKIYQAQIFPQLIQSNDPQKFETQVSNSRRGKQKEETLRNPMRNKYLGARLRALLREIKLGLLKCDGPKGAVLPFHDGGDGGRRRPGRGRCGGVRRSVEASLQSVSGVGFHEAGRGGLD